MNSLESRLEATPIVGVHSDRIKEFFGVAGSARRADPESEMTDLADLRGHASLRPRHPTSLVREAVAHITASLTAR